MQHIQSISGKEIILPDHPQDYSEIMASAFSQENHSDKYFKLAWAIALYTLLILLWLPGFSFTSRLDRLIVQNERPQKRKVIKPPPELPLNEVVMDKRRKRTLPMPDLTPDEPEPVIAFEEAPEPELSVDDWEIGIPDSPPPPPQTDRIARVGQVGVEPPIFTKRVSPEYPLMALKVKLTGFVILEAVLRKDGQITEIVVLRGLGQGKFGFEERAIEALEKWEFLPGRVNNRPADVRMTLKIDFRIKVGS